VILDTQFLGGLVEQKPAARAKARELEDRGVPIRVPAGVVWEVYYGVENAAEEKRETLRRGYERLLQVYPVVNVDHGLARRAGELRGTHTRSNSLKNLDGADSMVAATGLSYDEAVVSNDSDFQDVDGLRVETY
jgi:predicted nucleic acid-binding protein